jgi:hypothetical protein
VFRSILYSLSVFRSILHSLSVFRNILYSLSVFRSILYSMLEEEKGAECGTVQTLFLKVEFTHSGFIIYIHFSRSLLSLT